MDIILLVIISFCFIRGYSKGFVAILLSLVATIVSIYVSINLSNFFSDHVVDMFSDGLSKLISDSIDRVLVGKFSSLNQLQGMISEYGLPFGNVINKILEAIEFEGELTAGQILAPSISNLLLKTLCFVVLFFGVSLVFKLIKFIVNKFVKSCGLSILNKCAGGVVGMIKGLVIFLLLFAILVQISELLMNKSLQNFLNNSVISRELYNFVLNIF